MGWRENVKALHGTLDRLQEIQGEIGPESEAWRPIGIQIEQVRDEIRSTGPYIPDSPGATVPAWMDPEEAAEYRAMSPEYANDLTYVPDEPYEYGFDDAEYYAEYYEYDVEDADDARRDGLDD